MTRYARPPPGPKFRALLISRQRKPTEVSPAKVASETEGIRTSCEYGRIFKSLDASYELIIRDTIEADFGPQGLVGGRPSAPTGSIKTQC